MNKLVIIMGALMCSLVANAATCKWNSGVVSLPSGGTAGKDQVTGYVWEFASSTIYDQVAAGTLDVIAEFGKKDYGSLGAYSATKGSTATGKVALNGTLDVSSPNQIYAVILYQVGTGNDAKYLVNYAMSGDVGTTGVTVEELSKYVGGSINLTPQGSAITADAWKSASVPEPTSGLMLLLGVGLMALKRKRA